MKCTFVILVLVTLCYVGQGHNVGSSQRGVLEEILRDYDERALPKNDSDPVVVRIGLALQHIIHVDQKTQVLKLAVWMRQYWTDWRLAWDPAEYNGTSVVYIPPSQHWKPDILFYDNADEDQPHVWETIPTTVTYQGAVTHMFPVTMSATCPQNVKNFPMDIQSCDLKFGSWAMDGENLKLIANGPIAADFNFNHSKLNGEWEVIAFTATENENYYGCCEHAFYDVVFTVVMKRHWRMIFMYLYIPNIFVNILTICQFMLPCDSSERCTLGITLFLSIIVFLLLLNGVLPNSDDIPIIISYMSTTLILNGTSQICNIGILWLHFSGMHDNHLTLPCWARDIVLHKLAKFLGMHRLITSDNEHRDKMKEYQSTVGLAEDGDSDEEEVLHVNDYIKLTKDDSKDKIKSSKEDIHRSVMIRQQSILKNRVGTEGKGSTDTLSAVRVDSSKASVTEPGAHLKSPSLLIPEKPTLKITLSVADNRTNSNQSSNKSCRFSSGHLMTAELKDNEEILTFQILKHLDDYKAERVGQVKEAELKCEWMQVAMVISRLLLFIFMLITVLMSICIICSTWSYYHHSHIDYYQH